MCGIAGYLEPPGMRNPREASVLLDSMGDTLAHRGPDDAGKWLDSSVSVGLAHRRLSILDLSPLGHQPMSAEGGRYQLVYNGEIYNYREIEQDLRDGGCDFKSTSDTEVLLAALVRWGAEGTLPRLNGMFAFAFWDGVRRELWLARDHFGKKPLFYGWLNQTLVFGSELKALRAHPDFQGVLRQTALRDYFHYGYVPAPETIYENVWKLLPSSFLKVSGEGLSESGVFQPAPIARVTFASAGVLEVESTLVQAVGRRMLADVPLGAFLSGGIDSSLVVALMQELSPVPVRTFTLGFHEETHNEADHAREVARYLGTNHCEQILQPKDALQVIPLLPAFYDEPFGDPSAIPTYLVSRLARGQVTVVLSGDGGDEVFGGYNRYLWAPKLWRILRLLPYAVRRLLADFLQACPVSLWGSFLRKWAVYPGEKLTKLGSALRCRSPYELYDGLISQWRAPDHLMSNRDANPSVAAEATSFLDWMMARDVASYLPDDILVKVDRASMAVSLEARAPFLDPEVSAVARLLPENLKIRSNQGKWVLRELLRKRLPAALFARPKAGFSLPLGDWLREDLRDWAECLIEGLLAGGLVRSEPVRARWRQHQLREKDWSYPLWTLLMFQAWYQTG